MTKPCTSRQRLITASRHHHAGVTYLAQHRPHQPAPALPAAVPADTAITEASAQARSPRRTRDRAAGWLRGGMLALGVLAGASAVVSWDAQYVLVRTVKHSPAVARALNLTCVGISLAMNALASAPGWRDLAIWVMPSAIYALASDTLIGVIRAWVIARTQQTGQSLADDEPTPIAVIGAAVLWLIRLTVAPISTMTGLRRWVIEECPVAPGRRAAPRLPRRVPKAIGPAPATRIRTRHRPPGPARPRPQPAARSARPPGGKAMTKIALLLAIALILLAIAKWAYFPFIPHRWLPRHRVRYLRLRLRLRLHPGAGHASIGELWLRWGRLAMFRHSGRTRPGLSFWLRALGGSPACSILIGRAHYRHALRLPLDEHAVVTSPPRAGKTGWLSSVILRYPGAVVSTTTKHDVFALTSGIRALRGPVQVFNPQSVGGVPSTFRWNPIGGCQDPATAIRRADAFAYSVSQQGVEDSTFWASKASDYLRAYFHAGALAGLDLTSIAQWVTGLDGTAAEAILAAAGTRTAWQWASQLAELRGHADKTAQTIRMTMSRALAFLADPALAAAVTTTPEESFIIEEFLDHAGTLYLIAETRGEDSPVAPLFACLASEIHFTAALIGSQQPGGRLEPPLLLALDEVTQICPVPVPSWLADSGGKGIQIITVAHGDAQLRLRWGSEGARIIADTSGAKIWLPGISDPEALDTASMLCGTAAMRERGDTWTTRQPIMTPEMIRQLPATRALIIRGGYSPVIARLRMAWNDPLYRHARQRRQTAASIGPAPEPSPEPAQVSPPPLPSADPADHEAPYPGDVLVEDYPGTTYPWDDQRGESYLVQNRRGETSHERGLLTVSNTSGKTHHRFDLA